MSTMTLLPVAAFVCLAVHLALKRNFVHPGVVHGALWLIISSGYIYFQSELNYLSPHVLTALILGIAAFSIGIGTGARFSPIKSQKPVAIGRIPLPAIIAAISAIGLVMIIFQAIEYVRPWANTYTRPDGTIVLVGPVSWLHLLRFELVAHQKGSLGIGSYVLNFCFAGAAYLLLHFRRVRPTLWLWPTLALALAFAVVSTGRTFILLLGCIVLGAAMPTDSRRKHMVLATAVLLAAGAFFLLPWMQGRFFLADRAFVTSALSYFLMPMAALDHLVAADLQATWGGLTFRTPFAVLRAIGVPVVVPDLVQPFVKVPAEINVYTVFSPYYRDFGLVGIATFMLLLGSLHGWVFRQLKTGAPIIIVANALLFYALIMQFFQDQYFSLMSQWIQILGWTYVFNKLQPLPGILNRDRS